MHSHVVSAPWHNILATPLLTDKPFSNVATGHKGQLLQLLLHTQFSDSCKSGEKFEGVGVGVGVGVMIIGLVGIVYAHQKA